MEMLNDEIIPLHETVIELLDNAEVSQEDLVTYNNMSTDLVQLSLDRNVHMNNFFKEVLEQKESGNETDIDIDTNLKKLFKINAQHIETMKEYNKKTEQIAEDSDYLELEENAIVYDPDTINVEEMNEEYKQLVMIFIESVTGSSDGTQEVTEIEQDLLNDQGNPEVVFKGEVTLDDMFQLQGQSNLPEGSILQMKTYEYGTENPYFKGDIEVEKDGSFAVEADLEDEALDGELLVVRLAYIPGSKDNEKNQGISGEEGEMLEGDFIHPYTDIKRTRDGAFAYAYLELEEEAEAPLEADVWGEKPNDYGDLDVWMEKVDVETHEKYYDITMDSNLHELTYIRAEIEIPGYEVAGYRSNTKVLPDGAFRFQIPRPDVDSDEINVVINAVSDKAIETEELYGANGEHFEGELVKKTKKVNRLHTNLLLETKAKFFENER